MRTDFFRDWNSRFIWQKVFHQIFCCCVVVIQLCLTLCDPMDCSLPGFSVYGILQARIKECLALPFSRDLPDPGMWPRSPTLEADSWLSDYNSIKFCFLLVYGHSFYLLLCHDFGWNLKIKIAIPETSINSLVWD